MLNGNERYHYRHLSCQNVVNFLNYDDNTTMKKSYNKSHIGILCSTFFDCNWTKILKCKISGDIKSKEYKI